MSGLSMNYVMLEVIGVLYFASYILFGYIYNPRYNSNGEINVWSVMFSICNTLLCSIQIVVILYYPRFVNFIKPVWTFSAACAILAVLAYSIINPDAQSIVIFMGLMRLIINTIKFLPQLYLNWLRQSTEGWSIVGVWFDLIAGFLFLMRIIIDSIERQKFDQFSNNLGFGVFMLALVILGCDGLFICQHVMTNKHMEEEDEQGERNEESVYQIDPAHLAQALDSGRTTQDKTERGTRGEAYSRATE